MGTITYEEIQNNTPANANDLNERFGQIATTLNGGLDSANFKLGGIPLAAISNEIFGKMWPVGSIYTNANTDTNPSELLGFGTWEAYATGRVLVGVDTSQTEFNAVNKTGGHKELQSHNHSGTTSGVGDHSHGMSGDTVYTSASGGARAGSASGQQLRWSVGGTTGAGAHSHSFTTNNAGGGNAGNLQPFTTVYMWRRTG